MFLKKKTKNRRLTLLNNYQYFQIYPLDTSSIRIVYVFLQKWNEDQGNNRYSGSIMWPGANYAYQGKNITYFKSFDADYDFMKRVDDVTGIL